MRIQVFFLTGYREILFSFSLFYLGEFPLLKSVIELARKLLVVSSQLNSFVPLSFLIYIFFFSLYLRLYLLLLLFLSIEFSLRLYYFRVLGTLFWKLVNIFEIVCALKSGSVLSLLANDYNMVCRETRLRQYHNEFTF